MSDPVSDAELLEQARRGSAHAWELIVERHQRLVYSVALRSGLPPEDAVDVVQTAFLALLESRDGLREDERLVGWLTTVTRRQAWRARERRLREQPRPRVVPDAEDTAPGAARDEVRRSEPADSGGLVEWERVADVHTALARLGSPCRELLEALYFEDERPSYRQIARRMGRSVGGLGPLRGRCLARLRTLLEEER